MIWYCFGLGWIMVITENDYNYLLCTAATIYRLIRTDEPNINELTIELNDELYNITFENNNINWNNKIYECKTNYNIGDFVFESQINCDKAICQLITQKGPNEIMLQYKGLKFTFNIEIIWPFTKIPIHLLLIPNTESLHWLHSNSHNSDAFVTNC